jgi:transcription antitermination factor NusG
MQKNWYVVYTKPQCEKKVAALFSKWKIDNFCPLNCVKANIFRRGKVLFEPLFKSYVFVHITNNEIDLLYKADGVLNLLYWLGKPAIIKDNEIEAIKEFTNDYQYIRLEKTKVNVNDKIRILDGPSYTMGGNFISVENKVMKVNLPSLGFTIIAEMEKENVSRRQNSFLKNISTKLSNQLINTG